MRVKKRKDGGPLTLLDLCEFADRARSAGLPLDEPVAVETAMPDFSGGFVEAVQDDTRITELKAYEDEDL